MTPFEQFRAETGLCAKDLYEKWLEKRSTALNVARGTLMKIAATPHNRGAKLMAMATMDFISTQLDSQNVAEMEGL